MLRSQALCAFSYAISFAFHRKTSSQTATTMMMISLPMGCIAFKIFNEMYGSGNTRDLEYPVYIMMAWLPPVVLAEGLLNLVIYNILYANF